MAPTFIAEVKTRSPFGFESQWPWEHLFEIAEQHGDWVAVHTDPSWDGSFKRLWRARKSTTKTLVAKGIHATDDEVRAAIGCGADYVLVVGRLPHYELLPQCLIEPLSLPELLKLPHGTKAVWNSRDLSTGGLKTESFRDARNIHKRWLCQASNIKTWDDVQPDADAVLVGSHLVDFVISSKPKNLEP